MLQYDPPVRTVEIGKATLGYRECGRRDGPPLVLLHGLAENSAYFWRPLIEEFEADYRIIAIDLLGYGESSKPWWGYDPTKHIQLYLDFINYLNLKPVTLVGHSLGGIISARLAATHPDYVSKLILYDTPVPKGLLGNTKLAVKMPKSAVLHIAPLTLPGVGLLADYFPKGSDVKRIFLKNILKSWKVPYDHTQLSDELIDHHMRSRVYVMEQSIRFLFIFHNLEEYLQRIAAPTLMLIGDNDVLLPDYRVNQLRQLLPKAEVHIIPNAGHLSLFDQPTIFCQRMRQFLVL